MYATMQARTVVVRHSCPRRAPLRASPTRPRLVVAAQGQQTPPPAGKGDAENRRRQQDELKSSLKKMVSVRGGGARRGDAVSVMSTVGPFLVRPLCRANRPLTPPGCRVLTRARPSAS